MGVQKNIAQLIGLWAVQPGIEKDFGCGICAQNIPQGIEQISGAGDLFREAEQCSWCSWLGMIPVRVSQFCQSENVASFCRGQFQSRGNARQGGGRA